MKNPTWPKVFALTGIAVIAFAAAYFATAVDTAGIAAGLLGKGQAGTDLLTWGSALLLTAVALMAAAVYLALRGAIHLLRGR
jgi:hypothetical protein